MAMTDHGKLADEHEETADRLQRESDRVGEHADDARSKLAAAQGDSFIPEALGQEDPGHLEASNAELEAQEDARREQDEAEAAKPDTIGESVDQRLEDVELGTGGERGRNSLDEPDKLPGGSGVDDVPEAGGGDGDED